MKCVIVSWEFPPSRVANARRPALLARDLHGAGHTVEVLTREASSSAKADPVEWSAPADLVVHRVSDPVLTWLRKWERFRLVRGLTRRLWPDAQLFWVFRAARRLRRIDGPVVVIASILPVSMLLLRRLVPDRRFHFVYDYLESVTPFRREVPHEFFPHRQLTGWLARIERATLSKSDQVVFTSAENREAYLSARLCCAEKAAYIPLGCDSNPYAVPSLPCAREMVVSYVGYFNQDRTPETFLRGLRMFLDGTPSASSRVALHCHGNGLGVHGGLAEELNLNGAIRNFGSSDYGETPRILATSHVLLLVTSPKHRLFFPSKLSEYIAAGRPILAITPAGSEAAMLMRRTGRGAWICDNNPQTVARCLGEAWEAFQRGDLGKQLPGSAEIMTGHYTKEWQRVLESAVKGGGAL